MYANLVVGYDDSPSSRAALKEAAGWVKRHGGALALVHAVFFDTEEFGIAPEQLEKRVRVGERLCALGREKAAADSGTAAPSILCEGEPADVILDAARERGADLIVLGTYGRRGLRRMLMGSVTSQVVGRSRVDVLVVKRPCGECSGAYASVLVPFDGSFASRRALERACELAKADGTAVTALYSIPRYEEMVGFFKTEAIDQSLRREAEKVVAEAASLASGLGVRIATEVVEGRPADRVVERAARGGFELVAMGSHGHRGVDRALLGSTAERVILGAGCPVLVAKGAGA